MPVPNDASQARFHEVQTKHTWRGLRNTTLNYGASFTHPEGGLNLLLPTGLEIHPCSTATERFTLFVIPVHRNENCLVAL